MLIQILLISIAILDIFAAILIFVGTSKADKMHGFWFLMASISAAVWALSVVGFRTQTEVNDLMRICIVGIYSSAVFMDIGMLGYVGRGYKHSGFISVLFIIFGIMLVAAIFTSPNLLYSDILINDAGNTLVLCKNWFYNVYLIFFSIITILLLGYLIYNIKVEKNKIKRIGKVFMFLGLLITGTLSCIFDLVLPVQDYSLIWIGPLAVSMVIVSIYLSIVRYQTTTLSIFWLKTLSSIILIFFCTIFYITAIYGLIQIFMGKNAQNDDVWRAFFLANIILLVVALVLLPIGKGAIERINKLIAQHKIDYSYIMYKIDFFRTSHGISAKELAEFLAEYLHYSYVGFAIDGKLYGSSPLSIDDEEVGKFASLGGAEKGIWQEMNKTRAKELKKIGIHKVAELKDANGIVYGQTLLGELIDDGIKFSNENQAELEKVLKTAALAINK